MLVVTEYLATSLVKKKKTVVDREDWVEVKLGEIFETITGKTPSKKDRDNYGGTIPFIKPPALINKKISAVQNYITDKGALSSRILPRESVLVTCIGVLGRCGITMREKSAFNQQINAVLPCKGIEPLYTFYQLQGPVFGKYLSDISSATTVPIVNKSKFNSLPFIIPPLPEQRAIVTKLENLFTELDGGIDHLKKARAQLKIYRQAVLKKAFEGELTREWREAQTDLPTAEELLENIRYKRKNWIQTEIKLDNNEAKRLSRKIHKLKVPTAEDNGLPNSWKTVALLDACNLIVDCHNKTAPYEKSGIYLIRTSNIKNGKLDLIDKIKYVSKETHEYWSRRCIPMPYDILFTREAPMGEAAIIPEGTKICLGQRTMLIRVFKEYLLPKFLLYSILGPAFQDDLKQSAVGSGVKHIRVGDVDKLVLRLCSLPEQQKIVGEIESRLSVVDRLEADIEANLQKAESLRQSILKKAFAGRLLTEEELAACRAEADWEPAAVLLERIRGERA